MALDADTGQQYSSTVGFIYTFNLVVGVGSLALPFAFYQAGVILSSLFIFVVAFFSFIGVTFVVESISATNALLALDISPYTEGDVSDLEERTKLVPDAVAATDKINSVHGCFAIERRTELGLMAEMLWGKWGTFSLYLILCLYLYGDLAIYAVSVPLTLNNVIGWPAALAGLHLSPDLSYYFYLAVFAIAVLPFCFLNFQKTKLLQISTMLIRNSALFCMVLLSVLYIGRTGGALMPDIPLFRLSGVPLLFGTAVYAFMCHHSVPGLITPLRSKSSVHTLLGAVTATVLLTYTLVGTTALAAFSSEQNPTCELLPGPACKIQPLYTLNFASHDIHWLASLLALFPVFTLSSNFPLISITLRNNLLHLFLHSRSQVGTLHRMMFSVLATFPALALAVARPNLQSLVSFTGSFAGLAIMFLIPTALVVAARRRVEQHAGVKVHVHSSPFRHPIWVTLMYVWSALCFGMAANDHLLSPLLRYIDP